MLRDSLEIDEPTVRNGEGSIRVLASQDKGALLRPHRGAWLIAPGCTAVPPSCAEDDAQEAAGCHDRRGQQGDEQGALAWRHSPTSTSKSSRIRRAMPTAFCRLRRRQRASVKRAGSILGGIGNLAAALVLTAGVGVAIRGDRRIRSGRSISSRTRRQALRPAIERSRIAAEALQVLAEAAKRAGSEDGLEAIVDSAQELQLQLGEIALVGGGRAVDALNALGLESSKLKELQPEEAFRAVLAEIQKIPNVAERAIAAEEVFGGTSEKLAGIINLTGTEFAALEAEVRKTSDIWSGDALTSAKDFDQELQNLKTDLGRGANALVVQMLPALTSMQSRSSGTTGVPAWQELKALALEPVTTFLESSVVPVLQELATNLKPIFEDAVPAVRDAFDNLSNNVFPNIKSAYDSNLGWILPGGALIKGAQARRRKFRLVAAVLQRRCGTRT